MIVNILEGRELPIYGDGANVRDWLFVEDHCRAIDLILEKGVPGEVYNVGGRSEYRNVDLVRSLCALVDERYRAEGALAGRFPGCPAARRAQSESLMRFVRDRPGHDRRYAIDCTKITRELGFSPSVSLTDGLARTLEWYLRNETWWRQVMDGSYREWINKQYTTSG
jgi:dTDP-glucose 4,6-dehydratase